MGIRVLRFRASSLAFRLGICDLGFGSGVSFWGLSVAGLAFGA